MHSNAGDPGFEPHIQIMDTFIPLTLIPEEHVVGTDRHKNKVIKDKLTD